MAKYVLGIDCGTSEIKVGIFDLNGRNKIVVNKQCPCKYFPDGRVRQNILSIKKQTFLAIKEAIKRSHINSRHIAALAISNQRATVLCIDKAHKPIGHALSWQDMQGAQEINKLRKVISDERYYRITGLPNHPVFTLGKILWLKSKKKDVYQKTHKFILLHEFLSKELGCTEYFMDHANASLTGLFDIKHFAWSEEILKLIKLEKGKLAEAVPSGTIIGKVSLAAARQTGLMEGTPIVAGAGDQQSAGIGAGVVRPGVAEITFGTAGVTLLYSDKKVPDPKRRVMCCCHAVPGKWEVEGLQNSAGASLGWIKKIFSDNSHFKKADFARVKKMPPGSEGVFFYPYLAGAAAPHWNPKAKAMFFGLQHMHQQETLIRAVMEGVTFETKQIVDVFHSMKIPIKEIRLTGGCSNIDIWNQIQADILGKKVSTLKQPHATLLGAAMLAAFGVKAYDTLQDAADAMVNVHKVYHPKPAYVKTYKRLYQRFNNVYDAMDKQDCFDLLWTRGGQS